MDNNIVQSSDQVIESELLKDVVKEMEEIKEIGADSYNVQQKLGVLQRIVTAILEDNEYRQVLNTANFISMEQANLAADAINERKRYGVAITPVIDRVTAQNSVKGDRIIKVIGGMTRFNIESNHGGNVPGWKKRNDDKSIA